MDTQEFTETYNKVKQEVLNILLERGGERDRRVAHRVKNMEPTEYNMYKITNRYLEVADFWKLLVSVDRHTRDEILRVSWRPDEW